MRRVTEAVAGPPSWVQGVLGNILVADVATRPISRPVSRPVYNYRRRREHGRFRRSDFFDIMMLMVSIINISKVRVNDINLSTRYFLLTRLRDCPKTRLCGHCHGCQRR
jgi:hypothetical protein